MADERLIVALDVHSLAEVKELVTRLGDSVSYYKVGMELYYSVGKEVITYLYEHKKSVFLDLKLHDIPNTVAEGLCSLLPLGVTMLNVHASGGYTMMHTAVERIKDRAKELNLTPPKVIAVTILTSIGEADWQGLGYTCTIQEQVIRLAKLAKEAGMDGVVASPEEASLIRAACGEDFLIVTPGVRPAGASIDDQNRIATPAQALQNGATHLVVGRPIRAAADPVAAANNIIAEMEKI